MMTVNDRTKIKTMNIRWTSRVYTEREIHLRNGGKINPSESFRIENRVVDSTNIPPYCSFTYHERLGAG